ncbi:hypothetical protein LINPERPRIM_LOCUS33739 [Linum perenne]
MYFQISNKLRIFSAKWNSPLSVRVNRRFLVSPAMPVFFSLPLWLFLSLSLMLCWWLWPFVRWDRWFRQQSSFRFRSVQMDSCPVQGDFAMKMTFVNSLVLVAGAGCSSAVVQSPLWKRFSVVGDSGDLPFVGDGFPLSTEFWLGGLVSSVRFLIRFGWAVWVGFSVTWWRVSRVVATLLGVVVCLSIQTLFFRHFTISFSCFFLLILLNILDVYNFVHM